MYLTKHLTKESIEEDLGVDVVTVKVEDTEYSPTNFPLQQTNAACYIFTEDPSTAKTEDKRKLGYIEKKDYTYHINKLEFEVGIQGTRIKDETLHEENEGTGKNENQINTINNNFYGTSDEQNIEISSIKSENSSGHKFRNIEKQVLIHSDKFNAYRNESKDKNPLFENDPLSSTSQYLSNDCSYSTQRSDLSTLIGSNNKVLTCLMSQLVSSCVTQCYTSVSKVSFNNHMVHPANKHISSSNKYSDELVRNEMTSSGKKLYICTQCNYRTIYKSCLTRHSRKHTREKPYACHHCDFRSSWQEGLKAHILQHTDEKPYACQHCDYKTRRKSLLMGHIRQHTREEPFACDHCHYESYWKERLIRHMRRHTGKQPYSCNYCEYKSFWKQCYMSHIRQHTGEKPFACDHCGYKTRSKHNLRQHNRKHTGDKSYACDHCSYKSFWKDCLIKHIRQHTGIKPYSCDLCEYKSSCKSHITVHRRLHTGEKPFLCKHCNYRSQQISNLNRHSKVCRGRQQVKNNKLNQ